MFHCSGVGDSELLSSQISAELISERLENGLTLLHLCCASLQQKTDYNNTLRRYSQTRLQDITSYVSQSPDILQLNKDKLKGKETEKNKNDKDVCKETQKCKSEDSKKNSGKENSREHVRILLDNGADPAIISKNGFSPLHLASYKVSNTYLAII